MKPSYWFIPVCTVLYQYSTGSFHPGGRDSRCGDIVLMFEYTSIHNTCKLRVVLDSKVIKTQLRLDLVNTCHMLLYTCHSLVYPDIHQLYFESIISYLWGSFGCLNLHGCTSRPGLYRLHGILESEFDKSLFRQWPKRYIAVQNLLYFESGFVSLATPTVLRRTLLACFTRCCLPLDVFSTLRPPRRGLPQAKLHSHRLTL
jgi:hypothetical protein